MDRRTLLAMTLVFLIFVGWQKFYLEPRMPKHRPSEQQEVRKEAAEEAHHLAEAAIAQLDPGKTTTLALSDGTLTIGERGSLFQDWVLHGFKKNTDQSGQIDIREVTHEEMLVQVGFEKPEFLYLAQAKGALSKSEDGAVIWSFQDARVNFTREYRASPKNGAVELNLKWSFKGDHPQYAFISMKGKNPKGDPEEIDRQFAYYSNGSVERLKVKGDLERKEVKSPLEWVSLMNRYFVFALVSPEGVRPQGVVQPISAEEAQFHLVYPIQQNTLEVPLTLYFGPKSLDNLRAVAPTLDHAVDFGWFTIFAYPLLRIMKWLNSFVHNYGIAIIILTILLKLATYPLTYRSMKGMREMAKIQPQIQKLKEKYKDDKEAQNREMMLLMRNHGYNPLAGCLPILVQMPVFFALYRVLYGSVELYQAPFGLWIHDLSLKDPFYVTPVFLALTMFLQQKITPTNATMDPAQQKVMQFMPLMFGAMMINLPAGLTVYMLTNALSGIVQQFILNRKLGGPSGTPALARAK